MIVLSFLTPRQEHPRWRDYASSLRLLQTSCDRLGLTHLVISDQDLDGYATFRAELPRDLMPAILTGQAAAIEALDDDLLLVGADCVIARNPAGALTGCDMAVTLGNFSDCRLNTGAIWVRRSARRRAVDLWRAGLAGMGNQWGDDQIAIAAQLAPLPDEPMCWVHRAGLDVGFLPVDPWNLAPSDPRDDCSHAVVLHFRGSRKVWAGEWCNRFLGFGDA